MPLTQYESIIKAKWIISVDENNSVLEDHAIAIKDGRIAAIFPVFATTPLAAETIVHLDHHVVMPGLINLHAHSAMTLLRGLADDKPLMDWLHHHIWPAEAKHMRNDFVRDGSLIAMAQMIRAGNTTVNDMYFFHKEVATAGLTAGMRTFIGCSILEFPTNYGANADDYITRALAERREFLGEDLITFTLAPHSPYAVSDETFRKVVNLAEQENMLIHCHVHETQDEIQLSLNKYHQRPLARLYSLGLLSERFIAAHMVHLNNEEIELTARHGVRVAHNPTSNMKLASGIAPIPTMLQHGITVGVGTDGAASNNKIDMLAEIRMAALLGKVSTSDPTAIPAVTAIRMGTLYGAQALGIEDKVGSVAIGKEADLIAIDLSWLETTPVFDPVSHVVYAASREQISHVWVKGKTLLADHQLMTLDECALKARAEEWRLRIQKDTDAN